MIDEKGFRFNVGIILVNAEGKVFWGLRYRKKSAWQFPQGGLQTNETPEEAMFRELHEEVGLEPSDVKVLGKTQDWLYYHLPKRFRRYHSKPLVVGQKQQWFLVQLLTSDDHIDFYRTDDPEFGNFKWVDYWYPLKEVVSFKRKVYKQALTELEPLLSEIEPMAE